MSLLDLAILYTLLGFACAVAIYRAAVFASAAGAASASPAGRAAQDRAARLRALGSAALAIPLWPLWAPIALGRRPGPPPSARHATPAATARVHAVHAAHAAHPAHASAPADPTPGASPAAEVAARIEAALAECVDACAGTPVGSLLPAEAAGRISAEVARAAARHAELSALLLRPDFHGSLAERRLAALEAEQAERASPRAVATARLHVENVRRLAALRDRDARALEELEDLVQALRAQLLLARYAGAALATPSGANAGAAIEGTSGIVAEVWARVEGLSAVLESHDALEPVPPHAPDPVPAPVPVPVPVPVLER